MISVEFLGRFFILGGRHSLFWRLNKLISWFEAIYIFFIFLFIKGENIIPIKNTIKKIFILNLISKPPRNSKSWRLIIVSNKSYNNVNLNLIVS